MDSVLTPDIVIYLPLVLPLFLGLMIYVVDLLWKDDDKDILVYIAAIGLIAVFILLWRFWLSESSVVIFDQAITRLTIIFLMIFVLIGILTIFLSHEYYQAKGKSVAEYLVYFLFTTFGLMVALLTNHLLVIFCGMVISTISITFLIKFYGNAVDQKVVHKLWFFGLIVDLVFFAGVAFYFGSTGSFVIESSGAVLENVNRVFTGNYFRIAIALMGGALFAKVGIVPFHWPMVDIAKFRALPLISTLSFFYRAGFLFLILHIFLPLSGLWSSFFETPVLVLAVLTMTVANFAAAKEENYKNIIVYSSIAWVGYFLVLFSTIISGRVTSISTMIVFIVAFAVLHIGALGVLQFFSTPEKDVSLLSSYNGLGKRYPWLGIAFSLFLLGLSGAPLLVGFWVKYLLVNELIVSGRFYVLAIVCCNLAISLACYMKPIAKFYLPNSDMGKERAFLRESSYALIISIVFLAAITISLGLFPESFINWLNISVGGG